MPSDFAAQVAASAATAPVPPPQEVTTPTFIAGGPIDAITFGGKAASLKKLSTSGFNVPRAWAIPCKASLTRPLLNFPSGWSDAGPFAVRSGAPVSMPGMLETKLNVPYSGLRAAIRQVWDSWNSPQAKLYRIANGISDDLGTGCIIQQMVPGGVKIAGVALTVAPGDVLTSGEFAPVIEYVDGTGDALVSGANSGKPLTEDSVYYNPLTQRLAQIHKLWGASDVEWAFCKNGYVWFLQWRPMKFPPPVLSEADEGRTILAFGRPIGGGGTVVAKIQYPKYFVAGDALYLETFAPETYPLMMKAKAILTLNGGNTCHAAIVARSMGLPAISNLTEEKMADLIGTVARINGATGVLTAPTEADKLVVEAPAKPSIPTAKPIPPVVPNLSLRMLKWPPHLLLTRFYKAIDDAQTGAIPPQRLEEIANEIAQVFAAYQYIICATEARWAPGGMKSNLGSTGALSKEFQARIIAANKLGVPLQPFGSVKAERSTFAHDICQPEDLSGAIAAMEHVSWIFRELPWGAKPGAGGPKWEAITNHLLRYLRGDIPNVLYVDGNFNLQHNGGLYFNKFDWLHYDSALSVLLNAKQAGSKQFLKAAAPYLAEKLVTAKSIFTPGIVPPSGEFPPKKLAVAAGGDRKD